MPGRIVEVILPKREAETLQAVLAIEPHGGPWRQELAIGIGTALVIALAIRMILTQA